MSSKPSKKKPAVALAKPLPTTIVPGQIDTDDLSITPERKRALEEKDALKRARMSAPGALGLPPLLEKRRLEYGLVDDVFHQRALYERILVWQIPPTWAAKETFGDTKILMPEITKDNKKAQAPLGIIVSAGLKALEQLNSNGVDLGHIVSFIRLSPWRMPIAMVGTEEIGVKIMWAGDLIASYDLEKNLRDGKVRYELDEQSNQWLFVDENNKRWVPMAADASEDV